MKYLVIMAVLLAGCTTIAEVDALDSLVWQKSVDAYCALPEKARVMNRARINHDIAPHHIELECSNEH